MGENRSAYRLLMGKPEGKRPLGRPRRRWVDNIRIDLDVNWIGLAEDRDRWRALANSVFNLRVHKLLGNYSVSKQLGNSLVVLIFMELVS
jgi:hypothetical protein